ncbi:hypothetical protein BJX99DRAFT_200329 [Aspergillus californicus]
MRLLWSIILLAVAAYANVIKLGIIQLECNATALRKQMELPDEDMGVFYNKELPRVTERIVPDNHDDLDTAADMSTAVIKRFTSIQKRKQYSTGTDGLSGCTTLYIISRRGVYATHWWENVSFAPDEEWRDPNTQTDEELFEETVLDLLRNGGRFHPTRLDATAIEDNFIRAYVIRPTMTSEETEGDVGYTEQLRANRTTVGDLVPTLQDEGRWTDIPYIVKEEEDLFAPGATAGRNLFKYDPSHRQQGESVKMAKLWVEGRRAPYHDDVWN